MKKFLIILGVVIVGLVALGAAVMGSGKAEPKVEPGSRAKVAKGDIVIKVIESGALDAMKSVEVKSRVSGRLAKLLVDEGDEVRQGQLIAVIDPQETQLRVRQDQAQLRGAQSAVERHRLEIAQRRVTAAASVAQAEARVAQLEAETKAQPTLTSAAIQQAEIGLAQARQERDRLVNSGHPTQRTAAQSALREAEASFENAKREFDRQQGLLERGYVSARATESAKLGYDLAKVRLEAARDNLARLDSQISSELAKADEQIRMSEAELRRARANSMADGLKQQEYRSAIAELAKARAALRDAEIMQKAMQQSQASVDQISSVLGDSMRQLGETEIRAPLDGIVSKKLMQEGELVSGLSSFSSGSPIVRIEDRRSMRVKLDVNEIDVARLTIGLGADVQIDALPKLKLRGAVYKIAPASKIVQTGGQNPVVKYEVEIKIQDSDPRLRSGMSAKCTLVPIKREQVLTLPVEFIGRDGDKRFVELPPTDPKAKGAKPERRTVELGLASAAKVEIVSGVTEGLEVQKPKYGGPERRGMMQMGPDE